jgi:hypothetical protein
MMDKRQCSIRGVDDLGHGVGVHLQDRVRVALFCI